MEKEEAIRVLEPGVRFPDFRHTADDVDEACRIAVAALRAQQTPLDRSLWEGCKTCCGKYSYAYVYGVSYCPNCGRPITEEAWAELERRIIKTVERLDRLRELAQAEKDGRLVVLDKPRKPLVWGDDTHDTILCPNCNHDLMGGFPEDEYCEKDMYQCPYCGQSIDSTKVMTREEAEAAPKKKEGAWPMTREEAIKILSPNSESPLVRAVDGFSPTQKVLCALEMAVSALRAQ